MLKYLLAASLIAFTAGCETARGPVPAQAVYATSGAVNTALGTVDLYARLPLCRPAGPALCHKLSVLERASAAGKVADAALVEAEKIVLDPDLKSTDAVVQSRAAAEAALRALQAITNTLVVK